MKYTIALRIKELRMSSRLSQQQVAKKLFITQAAYSLIETGRNMIAVDHVIRLSEFYQRTTDYLLLGKE